ncbi:bifunctional DNA primase/polymerase [Pseudonocardia xishanensis]|uniref:Bifunctional DNA primase/polymerase n=1 Tax=Pseudonocardia xishanensis TaxID=630995 RepID=A0ABP8S497_9PSEU
MTVPSALEAALDYAAGGAEVMPLHTPTPGGCSCMRADCTSIGKHPRTLHGKDDATTDVETIQRWWRMWPTANVGIRPAEGLVVLDIDPRNGGHLQLAAMQERYGWLPRTRTARTGSGGMHLWFRCTGDLRGALTEGIDLKTHGGYLVAPPSVHACGQRYAWLDTGPIVDAPDYLVGLIRRPERAIVTGAPVTEAVVAGLVRTVRTAANGSRNRALYWAACRAVEKGIDPAPLVEAAVANGLSAHEAQRTVDSAATAPHRIEVAG